MLSADELMRRHSRTEACNAVIGIIIENLNRELTLAYSSGDLSLVYDFNLLFDITGVPQDQARLIILAEVVSKLQNQGYTVKIRGNYETDMQVRLHIWWTTDEERRKLKSQKDLLRTLSSS